MGKELSVGEMAELNGVTIKTLHLYHRDGLLEPHRVDEQTGYRYYTIDQCPTIDMIKQLQGMGMTLEEIRKCSSQGQEALLSKVRECMDDLDRRILELEIARHNARKLVEGEAYEHGSTAFGHVMLERLGHPRILRFGIMNPACGDLEAFDDARDYLDEWELNLRLLRTSMDADGVPLGLFHDVGRIVSAEDLLARRMRLSGAYVFVEGPASRLYPDAERMPGGMTLTLYKNHYIEPDGGNAEAAGIRQILDYADENGFEVAGDYFGRIIRDTPAFGYEGRDMLLKLQVPVRVKGSPASGAGRGPQAR
jgi:DNA-binding transcriptional MerR regulator